MTPHPPTSVMRPPADSVVRAVVRSTQFRSFTSQTSPVLVKLAPPTIKKRYGCHGDTIINYSLYCCYSEETDDIMMTSVDPCSKSAVVSALKAKRWVLITINNLTPILCGIVKDGGVPLVSVPMEKCHSQRNQGQLLLCGCGYFVAVEYVRTCT